MKRNAKKVIVIIVLVFLFALVAPMVASVALDAEDNTVMAQAYMDRGTQPTRGFGTGTGTIPTR